MQGLWGETNGKDHQSDQEKKWSKGRPYKEEYNLKDHIIHLAKLRYPLTRSDVLTIATQTAVFLKVKTPIIWRPTSGLTIFFQSG